MKISRFNDAQIIVILKQAETGSPMPALYHEHDKKEGTPSARREMVSKGGGSLRDHAQPGLHVSQIRYRYPPVLAEENQVIPDQLQRLTASQRNWSAGYIFCTKGVGWNHKMVELSGT